MTQKFGRRFQLTIDPKDGGPLIVVTLPFTIQFWMRRDIMASLNNISIDVYNLSEANRRRIYQDRFDLRGTVINGVAQGARTVKLEVGYSQLYTVYEGDIFFASSAREGVNIVTRLEGLTGKFDIASSQTFLTVQKGENLGSIFSTLIGQFPSLKKGAVGQWPLEFQRAVVLNGNTWFLINQYSGGKAYIDNGRVYVLQDDEVIELQIPQIDASSGLLETPRREQGGLRITTLLEANIGIGQLINLKSLIEPVYDGQYKVIGVQHSGMISGAVGGDCRSVFSLLSPNPFRYPYRKVPLS